MKFLKIHIFLAFLSFVCYNEKQFFNTLKYFRRIFMELLAFILYFSLMLGIGLFFFVKSKSDGEKEYFLGGRAMGPWVTAMSAQASDMSGWLLMGFPGSILAFGLGKVWIGIGLALGTALNWVLVARRLRRFSQAANDSITLPQYLSNRFKTKSHPPPLLIDRDRLGTGARGVATNIDNRSTLLDSVLHTVAHILQRGTAARGIERVGRDVDDSHNVAIRKINECGI